MSLWILALIVQPILIRRKKFAAHRWIGRSTYVLMPLLLASIILLVYSRNHGFVNDPTLGVYLFVPFSGVINVGVAYALALVYSHDVNIHARAMIVTGIEFIEPPLSRLMHSILLRNDIVIGPSHLSYLSTIAVVYSIFTALIIAERKQKVGRWVFPLFLGLAIIFHSLILFDIEIPIWNSFAKWS